jgi:hypothetical protein
VEHFVTAETAALFDRVVANAGGVNRFFHLREPAPLDKQTVIRMNRDTIYSSALVNISQGATLTVPDAGGRYMSIMVVNEDHYLNKVIHEPGEHELTVEEFGTPLELHGALLPAAKGDSRWNLEVPRGDTCGIGVADHRVRTRDLESEDLSNETPLSSTRDCSVRHRDHRLCPGEVHPK